MRAEAPGAKGSSGQLGPPGGTLWYTVPEAHSQHSAPPPDPGLAPPLTWCKVCAEGTVDKGEVQHNG